MLVVGSPGDAEDYLRSLDERLELAQIVGFLRVAGTGLWLDGQVVASGVEEFGRLLEAQAVDEVVAAGIASSPDADRIARICVERGVIFRSLVRMPAP